MVGPLTLGTAGGGAPALVALWQGAHEGNDGTVQENRITNAIVTTVDKSVDKTDGMAVEPDVSGEVRAGLPEGQGMTRVQAGGSADTDVGERTVEDEPPALPYIPPGPRPN